MTLDIHAGFDIERLGPMTLIITGVPVTMSAGRYCHLDLSTASRPLDDGTSVDYLGGQYTRFGAALATQLGSTIGGTWTVTLDPATLLYTITRTGTGALNFPNTPAGNRMADTLGFNRNSSPSGTSTWTGTRRPWYVIRSLMGGKSRSSDEYEPRNVGDDGEAEDGSSYFTGRTITPLYWDFQVPLEPIEATHRHAATAAVPWTWQSFFDHVRGIEPIGVDDSNERGGVVTVHKLRANAAGFSPSRIREDWDGAWTVSLETRYLGEVPP
jgi:hypothetical protein